VIDPAETSGAADSDSGLDLQALFHRLNNQLGVLLAQAELLEAKAADDTNRGRAAQVVSSTLAALGTVREIRLRTELAARTVRVGPRRPWIPDTSLKNCNYSVRFLASHVGIPSIIWRWCSISRLPRRVGFEVKNSPKYLSVQRFTATSVTGFHRDAR
jgi:hypothetical protein